VWTSQAWQQLSVTMIRLGSALIGRSSSRRPGMGESGDEPPRPATPWAVQVDPDPS
jgi:hypothetical protein